MPKFRRRSKGIAKVKRDIKWLKKNVEFKFKDTIVALANANTTGSTFTLNLVADGPLSSERDGEEVTSRRLMIRGFFHNDHGTPVDCICRILVWRQRAPNAVTPTVPMVLDSVGVNSFRQMARKENIIVYLDNTFTMDTTQHSLIPFKFLKKLNHTVRYSGAGGTQADVFLNGLNVSFLSTVAGTVNNPFVTFEARYSYCDS